MRALFLNWRCTRHPQTGGAEYVTMQLACGLVKAGWDVVWFSMAADNLPAEEVIDGVKIIREGGPLTVQSAAKRWYKKQDPSYIDFVLDQSHGWPFFAPGWAKCPVMYLIHEVTGQIAHYMLSWPIDYIYIGLEHFIIRYYRNVPALTVSQSTKDEMRRYGHRAPIEVITCGLDTKPLKTLPSLDTKEKDLTVILAARLVPLKRPDQAIKMMAHLIKLEPKAKLWLVGSGQEEHLKRFKGLVNKLGLQNNVKFWGFVTLEKRQELMRRAHFVTITSIKEGWGLTIPESNALGTVGVTYNIGGVRDSNRNGENGILSASNTPTALAQAIYKLHHDQKRYNKLRQAAWEWSKTLVWEKTVTKFINAVDRAIKSYSKS